jgi:phage terminase large subunit-like protein
LPPCLGLTLRWNSSFRSAGSGREKFQGLTLDWVHIDEEPPKPIFEEIVARVGAGRALRVFISATLLPPGAWPGASHGSTRN